MTTTIFTIGYEGASVADFIAALLDNGIKRVVDVRQLPQSRRPGFSKNGLREALQTAGVEYEHRRQLGDPKPGRDAARAGNLKLFRSIFSEHMCLPASQDELKSLARSLSEKPSVLLCYERNPQECHRKLLCEGLKELGSFRVQHLGVRARLPAGRISADGADRHVGAC